MNRLKLLLFTALTALTLSFTALAPAYAWSPFGGVDCSGKAARSAVCKDKNTTTNPLTGSDGIIMQVATIVAFVAGAAAVIIIVLAGLRMITSGGSSDDIAAARRTIIYALVGLAVIIISRILIGFVISAL